MTAMQTGQVYFLSVRAWDWVTPTQRMWYHSPHRSQLIMAAQRGAHHAESELEEEGAHKAEVRLAWERAGDAGAVMHTPPRISQH